MTSYPSDKRRNNMPMKNSDGVKLGDILKTYDGSDEIEAWLSKVKLVSQLKNISDVAALIPLFLEGDALTVFLQRPEEGQKDAEQIKTRLREEFGEDSFQAYEEFRTKMWRGEPVDVYATELQRLARVAKLEGEIVRNRAFIMGLPPSISKELRAIENIEAIRMKKLITKTRSLLAMETNACLVGVTKEVRRGPNSANKCFRCRGPHLKRECHRFNVRCWGCDKSGHVI